jgi:hypothetical protein
VTCPQCTFENPPAMAYCGRCGARLAALCSSCGFANPAEFAFCGKCGTSVESSKPVVPTAPGYASPRSYTPKHLAEKILTSRTAPEGERKQVTVLSPAQRRPEANGTPSGPRSTKGGAVRRSTTAAARGGRGAVSPAAPAQNRTGSRPGLWNRELNARPRFWYPVCRLRAARSAGKSNSAPWRDGDTYSLETPNLKNKPSWLAAGQAERGHHF